MNSYLEINHLQHHFGTTQVLNLPYWKISAGKVHGLIGLNGAGKSTLFRLIASELEKQSGTIHWEGKPVHWRDVLHLPTEPSFYPGITGTDYLALFPAERPITHLKAWADLLHLPLHQQIADYSTGMKKKLGLMGLLPSARRLLLLDEPFNGLDLEAGQVLTAWLKERAAAGCCVLVAAHQLELLHGCCDEIHWLNQGELQGSYPPEALEELRKSLLKQIQAQMKQIAKQ